MLYLIETHGPITTNTYLYGDDETRHAFLIDPGFTPERILAAVREKDITVERILLTHGHFDHIGAALAVSDALGALPICMWEKGRKYAESPDWNLSANFFPPAGFTLPAARMTYLPDGACLALAAAPACRLHLTATPGHTEDGCSYISEAAANRTDGDRLAFVGDTIFRASYGATHFPGGDEPTLMQSIKTRLLTLPADTLLLSGHSEPTTVGEERTRAWYR